MTELTVLAAEDPEGGYTAAGWPATLTVMAAKGNS